MEWNKEWKPLLGIVTVFLVCFFLPVGWTRFDQAMLEALHLVRWYAREHVLLCLIPAFFIAGGIGVFVNQAAVMKYLGARAPRVLAYSVASVSGTILAVCSCTVLPLFAGIWRMGAGLGPATAFLYSGPAINVLAIVLTARVLGLEMGVARAVGAVSFSFVIGFLMHVLYRGEEAERAAAQAAMPVPEPARPLWQTGAYFATMIGILVFSNWGRPESDTGPWFAIFNLKWTLTAVSALGFGVILTAWFRFPWWKAVLVAIPTLLLAMLFPREPILAFAAASIGFAAVISTNGGELGEWFGVTWSFAKQILPLLLLGVLVAGALLGRPGQEGLIPNAWISWAVGGNSLLSNFLASLIGAFMYFATLTEVPILQGLIGSGMGKGPALALLLAGPALSLPSMLVLCSIMGFRKTLAYCSLVVIMSTVAGLLFGAVF